MGVFRFRQVRPLVAALVMLAVAAPLAAQGLTQTDWRNRPVTLKAPAHRVISLVPSVTETIMAIGASDRVVGRTRFDKDPRIAKAAMVGGGLDASLEALVALRPDLVVGYASAGKSTLMERLEALGVPTFAVDPQDTTDVFRTIRAMGGLLGLDDSATAVTTRIHGQLTEARRRAASAPRARAFFLVFTDPAMTTGRGTFIDQLLGVAGVTNVFGDLAQHWPTISLEELVRRDPDVLIVPTPPGAPDPLERYQGLPGWRDLRAVRAGRVLGLDGDVLERPGPRIGEAALLVQRAVAGAMRK